MERLAAEEYEKERVRVPRTRHDLNLNFDQTEAWPSSSRSSTPSSFASQEDTEADLECETPAASYTPSETGRRMRTLVKNAYLRLLHSGNYLSVVMLC